MSTAIEIMNAAASELGLPTVVLSTTTGDTLGIQTLALLNALGQELILVHDWQFLEQTMSFTGDGVADAFPLPADFARQINQTQWATSDKRPMMGPDSPQMWSWSQYGIVSVGVFFRYRILGNQYRIFPVPGAGESFALYYISKNWVVDQDSPTTLKTSCTKSGDIPIFNERLLIAGLKVKLWAQKGFDTTNLLDEFLIILEASKAQTQGARVIDLSGPSGHLYLNWQNIPETGYGV